MIDVLKKYPNGGKIEVYDLVDQTANDFLNVYACCDYFAMQGRHTIITPSFGGDTVSNPNYIKIYAALAGTPYWSKCPDFLVDGVWYEHEGFIESKDLTNPQKRADTFSKMMNRGIKQSDRLILEDCHVGRRWAKKVIFNRVHFEKQNIAEVYIKTPDRLELLYKK